MGREADNGARGEWRRRLKHGACALARFAFLGHPARAAVASFAAAVLVGTLLLALPISSQAREWTSFVDSLFTSTGAVCVTGLIVQSTPDHWSLFGQLVILTLIQIGGLGIMTLGAFMAIALRRRLSMKFERFMGDIVESNEPIRIGSLLKFICIFTFLAEIAGATMLYYAWRNHPNFADGSTWRCIYHSVFHSVSAFCNAGFSVNNDSLMSFRGSLGVNGIICALILVGGIGFVVVRDLQRWSLHRLLRRGGRKPRLSTHSRLVLVMTGALLVVGFAAFLCVEPGHSMSGASGGERMLMSIFQSITPRTAGFNTADMNAVAAPTVLVIMVLMYIGGSPSGTAGGVKTSTVGVMLASIAATLRGRDRAEMFHHSVPGEIVHRVASIILVSLMAIGGGVFLLLMTEAGSGASFEKILFEAVSAFGTVGLSRGLTGPGCDLSTAGRLVIIALMFMGRLGPMAIILSMGGETDPGEYIYPEDRILVG